jgi:hypothetical protein
VKVSSSCNHLTREQGARSERARSEFGEREFGEREFGEREFGEREFGEREFGESEFGESEFGESKTCLLMQTLAFGSLRSPKGKTPLLNAFYSRPNPVGERKKLVSSPSIFLILKHPIYKSKKGKLAKSLKNKHLIKKIVH